MEKLVIGVDPHKLSATIEVVDHHERVLASGRFGTDKAGYAAMRRHVAGWPERVWAVEGSNGAGRSLAQRLLADGEQVVDVRAKLSARARRANSPPARPGWKPSAAWRDGSPTPSTASSLPMPGEAKRVRGRTARRHLHPARSTCPRTSTLGSATSPTRTTDAATASASPNDVLRVPARPARLAGGCGQAPSAPGQCAP